MPSTYANGHISATGDPIYFMFGSRVGFCGDGGSNGAIYDSNKSKMAATAMFCSRVGFSGTAGLMALPPPSWIILNGHISATAHDLLI